MYVCTCDADNLNEMRRGDGKNGHKKVQRRRTMHSEDGKARRKEEDGKAGEID